MKKKYTSLLCALCVLCGLIFNSLLSAESEPLPLSSVRYWAYQIQDLDLGGAVNKIVNSKYDMVVIDPTVTWDYEFNAKDMVNRIKASKASDGVHRKLVIAYIDIGQADDTSGHTVTLGSKTITCDNANAVKPFGAIDTPTQGGIASGSAFVVWGWALTPLPRNIPTDGSTINVYVDGIDLGHPTYNIYRSDIAGLFPSYDNSNGAAGYFILDTTAYENGVHTLQWVVTDSGGNTDGIGSRYFVIQNTDP